MGLHKDISPPRIRPPPSLPIPTGTSDPIHALISLLSFYTAAAAVVVEDDDEDDGFLHSYFYSEPMPRRSKLGVYPSARAGRVERSRVSDYLDPFHPFLDLSIIYSDSANLLGGFQQILPLLTFGVGGCG